MFREFILIMRFLTVFTMGFVLTMSAHSQTPAPAGGTSAPAPAGNAETGKRLFDNYGCYQCHGHVGQGGAAPRLAPRPSAFAAFSRYVRVPAGQMPPYTTKVLSDQQIADMYAYLRSIPEPPDADSIPILRN
jgi:ubiquinol-cytochrome c reductase cytochrome c subunit